jgi:tRNA (pseudouridine54-N1)-methyltransferase
MPPRRPPEGMRQFVYVGHEAPATADFSLDDLAGAGRMDLLARSVTAALLLSHDIRADTRVHLVLGGTFTVTFDGATLQGLNPDERSTAARVRSALAEREEAIGQIPVEVSPGVSLVRKGFEETLEAAAANGTVVHLQADGEPAPAVAPPADPVFVLSDHREFDEEERAVLEDIAGRRVSLGPHALHADHATVLAHNWVDTDGFDPGRY